MSGIYIIINKVNNKTYIGSTQTTFADRWDNWRSLLNNNKGQHHPVLQNAWNKYGAESFKFRVLEEFPGSITKDEVREIEQWYFDNFKTHDTNGGYNIATYASHSRQKYDPATIKLLVDTMGVTANTARLWIRNVEKYGVAF